MNAAGTATLTATRTATRTAPRTASSTAAAPAEDRALDEALERISDLAARLWAVRQAHRPVLAGRLRRTVVCSGCGLPTPCPTLRAAG